MTDDQEFDKMISNLKKSDRAWLRAYGCSLAKTVRPVPYESLPNLIWRAMSEGDRTEAYRLLDEQFPGWRKEK